MNRRADPFWILYGAILLLVCGPLVFLLTRSRAAYADARTQLQDAEQAYERLVAATPFPSAENVEVARADLERARTFLAELLETLCRGDVRPEALARDLFGERLQITRDRLLALAAANGVELPGAFFFGFEIYAEGTLPRDEAIPRLTVQLKCVEALATVLLEGRVDAVMELRRDVFEEREEPAPAAEIARGRGRGRPAAPAAPAAPGPVPAVGKKDPFAVEPLSVAFVARDEQVWQVLDRLGAMPLFAVPTSVRLTAWSPPEGNGPTPERILREGVRTRAVPASDLLRSPGSGLLGRPTAAEETAADLDRAAAALRATPHDERVLAGRRERVRVELELDVYRFCADDETAAAPAAGGGA